MRDWVTARFASRVCALQVLFASAIVIVSLCGAPSRPLAAFWSSNGKLVVDVSPGSSFVEPNASIWLFLADRDYSHSRLIGRRKASGTGIATLTVDLAPGDYLLFLMKKESDRQSLMRSGCSVMINITAGSQTDVRLPVASSSSCNRASEYYNPGALPSAWQTALEWGRFSYQASATAMSAEPTPSPDPFWAELDRSVTAAQDRYCPDISTPLWKLHRQIDANPPTQPVVFVRGYAIGPLRSASGDFRFLAGITDGRTHGALRNMDLDADLVRFAVADVKARCWNWFASSAADHAEYAPPRGGDAELYAQDKEAVQFEQTQLDRLNHIADVLDRIANGSWRH